MLNPPASQQGDSDMGLFWFIGMKLQDRAVHYAHSGDF